VRQQESVPGARQRFRGHIQEELKPEAETTNEPSINHWRMRGETVSDGFLHFLQRLFGLGSDRPKQAQPAPPSKKNRPSVAPKRKGNGSAKKEPPGDKRAKKEPPSRDKPTKKVAAKPKPGTRPKAPPSAASTEASAEVPSHGPHGARQKESSKEMDKRKTEPRANPAPPPAGPAFDPKFAVLVSGNDIVITLMGTSYSVTYFKRKNSPGLFAKDITLKDDPHIPMTSAEFLTGAWKLANDKARELGWIV
jgi:hypothetical protein